MSSLFGRAPLARAIAVLFFPLALLAAASGARVTGTVTSSDGTPVAGTLVKLSSQGATLSAKTDAKGRFELDGVPFGTYDLDVEAPGGYAQLEDRTITVDRAELALTFVVDRATTNSLTTIGEVSASSGGSVSTSSAPVRVVGAQSAAASGSTEVSSMLWSLPSTTPVIPLGGGANALVSIALRGPDPTETLVDIDGHSVNNGNTGDFDLSLIDPSAMQNVQLIYGISPSSLLGPNTLGGAVNITTLEPTTRPTGLLRLFGGTFDSFGETLQSTGTIGRFGYAVSAHRATSNGPDARTVIDTEGDRETVGNAFFGQTLLSKLRYQLGDYGYLQVSVRDQAVNKDLSSLMTYYQNPGEDVDEEEVGYHSFAGTSQASHQANYGFDAQLPLGPGLAGGAPPVMFSFSHLTTLASQSPVGPGAQTNPYLYDQRDLIGDDWLQIDREFSKGTLSFKYQITTENLTTQFVPGVGGSDDAVVRPGSRALDAASGDGPATIPLAQTQHSWVLRYDGNPTSHIHYSLALYDSNFSVFGNSLDPRAGIVWTPNSSTAVRASAGTTFQAPQLSSLFVPPSPPPPVGGVISIGNPNLKPDRATEYDLGIEQIFGKTKLSLDLYRTNLRTPITTTLPEPKPHLCKVNPDKCPISMPINAGNGVYTGIDFRGETVLSRNLRLHYSWDVDSSYLTTVPPEVTDGSIVPNQQSLGQPLHKASFGFSRDLPQGAIYGADVNWEGSYNELNRAPYATLDAHLGFRSNGWELGLYGTNLTNVYADPFTVNGGGIVYGALPGFDPLSTNAYVLQGTKVVLVLTRTI